MTQLTLTSPRTYKAFGLNNFRQIPQLEKLDKEHLHEMEVVGNVLPFKVNNYVVEELIDWSDPMNDPIFKLTFPQKGMLKSAHYKTMEQALAHITDKGELKAIANSLRMELNPHPAGQMEYNVPMLNGEKLSGIQHKYRETVLFFPSSGQTCHAYCTFCFRWPQFTGMDEFKFAQKESHSLVAYLAEHPEVTDLLFTGGDPMIMKYKVFEAYINPILQQHERTNIQTIRIGTKSLAYWPYKFIDDPEADQFLRLFERIVAQGINLAFMAHFNHPRELETAAVSKAIRRLRSTGVQIRTQSPLLRHINDDPKTWATMWRKQVNLNCIPYYMFVARDTGAQHYFELPLIEAWNIFRQAYQQVSGVCRTVRGPSMSCTPGKVQLLGISEIPVNDKMEQVMVLRMLQGRDPDWVGKPFFAKYDEKATWMDQLQPAFGEFFFFDNKN